MKSRHDIATIAAIAIIAYILGNVLHEGVGHGGTCLLVGGKPLALSTAYFDWDDEHTFEGARRIVAAGGTIANLITGLLCWGLFRRLRNLSPSWRFFLFVSMAVNLLTATGYPLFSGVIGVGDWVTVVQYLEPPLLWRLILTMIGLVTYILAIWILLRELTWLVGGDPEERAQNGSQLCMTSYLAGSIGGTIGAFLNPISPLLIATSAAAHFGGTSGLAWMTQYYRRGKFLGLPLPERNEPAIRIDTNRAWQAGAVVLLLVHIFVLGPSIHF